MAGTAVNNYFFSPSKYQTDDAFNIRSDKIITAKNNMFVRVSRGRDITSLPGALPAPANSTDSARTVTRAPTIPKAPTAPISIW